MVDAPAVTANELVGLGVPAGPASSDLAASCNAAFKSGATPESRWRHLTRDVLAPSVPFAVHNLLYHKCYDGTPLPWPAYFPDVSIINQSNAVAFCRVLGIDATPNDGVIDRLHRASIADREAFWQAAIRILSIEFATAPTSVFSGPVDCVKYLPNARMNIVESCFSAPAASPAIRFQRESESHVYEWSNADLLRAANRVASALHALGLVPGDTAAIFMQMTAESVAIYLGIIKAGMVAVSVADSFSSEEVRTRLEIAECKVVFTQDFVYRGGKRLPMYERVVATGWPAKTIVIPGQFNGPSADSSGAEVACQIRGEGDVSWSAFLSRGSDAFPAVIGNAEDPINILFSSGTTGTPKAIPWNHCTPIKAATDAYLYHDIKPGHWVAWPTNFGWMMAPWLCFGSLLNRATVALFYGSPTSPSFCEFIANARVTMLGLIPSITKQLRAAGYLDHIDWSGVRRYSSTGEASNPTDQLWIMSRRPGYAPVVEYCGGTEIGGAYICGSVVQRQAPSMFSTLACSVDAILIGDAPTEGEVALIGPSLGFSNVILNQDHYKTYFAGMPAGPNGNILRRHGDRIMRCGSFYKAMGRADDTMKLGGIKISSVELENVCAKCPGVGECAAIAVPPADGGPDLLVIFVVLSKDASSTVPTSSLKDAIQQEIKTHLNPLFKVHDVCIVDSLPRTATAKVMRRDLRSRYTVSSSKL